LVVERGRVGGWRVHRENFPEESALRDGPSPISRLVGVVAEPIGPVFIGGQAAAISGKQRGVRQRELQACNEAVGKLGSDRSRIIESVDGVEQQHSGSVQRNAGSGHGGFGLGERRRV
jgi:hypothetical protein